jgi:beta-glucuronidase
MSSRRNFLTLAAGAAAVAPASAATAAKPFSSEISLDGPWEFHFDGDSVWRTVNVPHTWQIEPGNADYMGVAWYRRDFETRPEWKGNTVRVEFEAVFHSATVFVNGTEVGQHNGKGYTAFTLDITEQIKFGEPNQLLVRVDNAFNEAMLPRGKSSDWTHDGGIYRPVRLLVTPLIYIEAANVDASPSAVEATVLVRNSSNPGWSGDVSVRIIDDETNAVVLELSPVRVSVPKNETKPVSFPGLRIPNPKLWHFDHPHLYRLEARAGDHAYATTFGFRSIEVKPDGFYLNGERVRLMGVERMAGSNPEYGMVEPESWIVHDHDDMKNLNCVLTRVHWQQDRRVLDYCDRKGILIQVEVPTWGGNTFRGMAVEPSKEIMQNGLEQLREMIGRERNHPSVISWGVCNEIGGQNPPAYRFAQRMAEEAKRLDPHRPISYASNSLQKTPGKDVAGLMDFIEWNEYYGTWYPGTPAELKRNLEEIHAAFPEKPIVISEYGYCACTPERPEGDRERIQVLTEHNKVFRDAPYVAGLIFFCYNDYRTHVGDKGVGVAKQRVHGVVDIYGNRKPSYDVLRAESSPVDALDVEGRLPSFTLTIAARATVPAHTLRDYKVRGVLFGAGNIPLERVEWPLPVLRPGDRTSITLNFTETTARRVDFDVLRPNGFSVLTRTWTA